MSIRIREIDKSTEVDTGLTTNEFFIPCYKGEDNFVGYVELDSKNNIIKSSDSTEVTSNINNSNFVIKMLQLGGKIIVGKTINGSKEFLSNRNTCDVKFILCAEDTSTTELIAALDIADTRKDCVVIYGKTTNTISDTEKTALSKESSESDSFFGAESVKALGKYCKCYYANNLVSDDIVVPVEYAIALAYLNNLNNGAAEWLATAGSVRGKISLDNLSCGDISESEFKVMQETVGNLAINPVMNIRSYGVRIWGDKTALPIEAEDSRTFTTFGNIRVLLADLKKQLYKASVALKFEQNSDILWTNFQNKVEPLLSEMKSGLGILGYKWTKEKVSSNEKAKLKATLKIIPIEFVDSFDLTIQMENE
jgi:hypothetical protein